MFITAPVLAVDLNAEVFITHKASSNTADVKNEGTDLERFRVILAHKFDDNWAFKGRFEFKAGTADADATKNTKNLVYIPEAQFVGSSILTDGDTVKFGIIENFVVTAESAMGNRWISKTLMDDEGFVINSSTQSGASYALKFNAVNVTLFSLSGQSGDELDSNDNNKLNGVMLDSKFGETITAWLQHASYNTAPSASSAIAAAGAKNITVISAGTMYSAEAMNLSFNYHQASYSVETGTAPKSNTVMGVNGLFKKLMGPANLYFHYWTGFDKYLDTGEATSAKMMIGPTWNLADNKINLGVFYQAESYQSDYKDANAALKEPSAMYVKMAARF